MYHGGIVLPRSAEALPIQHRCTGVNIGVMIGISSIVSTGVKSCIIYNSYLHVQSQLRPHVTDRLSYQTQIGQQLWGLSDCERPVKLEVIEEDSHLPRSLYRPPVVRPLGPFFHAKIAHRFMAL